MIYSISQFAKLAQVSSKLLRHYDKIGLLQPASINPETGYRYYQIDQLADLNRILALRNLGFSLREVARLQTEHVSAEALRAMLRLKQAHLQQLLESEQQKLREVETRLSQLQAADHPPPFEIAIKRLAPLSIVALRQPIAEGGEIVNLFSRIVEQFKGQERRLGVAIGFYHLDVPLDPCVGSPLAFTLSSGRQITVREFPGSGAHDAEAAFVWEGSVIEPAAPLVWRELAGVETAASLVYPGPYSYRFHAYLAFTRWADANGYRVAGAVREIYLRYNQHPNHPDNLLEIQLPLIRQETA